MDPDSVSIRLVVGRIGIPDGGGAFMGFSRRLYFRVLYIIQSLRRVLGVFFLQTSCVFYLLPCCMSPSSEVGLYGEELGGRKLLVIDFSPWCFLPNSKCM